MLFLPIAFLTKRLVAVGLVAAVLGSILTVFTRAAPDPDPDPDPQATPGPLAQAAPPNPVAPVVIPADNGMAGAILGGAGGLAAVAGILSKFWENLDKNRKFKLDMAKLERTPVYGSVLKSLHAYCVKLSKQIPGAPAPPELPAQFDSGTGELDGIVR